MMVGVVSAACLKAASEPTASFQAGGIEKVMPVMTNRQVVNVAPYWVTFITQKEAQPSTVHINPGVLSEVRTSAATKIAAHRAPGVFNLKPAWLASSDPVHWKAAHRTPTAEVGFTCAAAAQPPKSPKPDNPALSIATEKTPSAWHMPADDNPGAIEGREGGRQEGSLV